MMVILSVNFKQDRGPTPFPDIFGTGPDADTLPLHRPCSSRAALRHSRSTAAFYIERVNKLTFLPLAQCARSHARAGHCSERCRTHLQSSTPWRRRIMSQSWMVCSTTSVRPCYSQFYSCEILLTSPSNMRMRHHRRAVRPRTHAVDPPPSRHLVG